MISCYDITRDTEMGGFRCLGFQGVVVYVDRLRNEEQAVDSCLHRPNKCLVVL